MVDNLTAGDIVEGKVVKIKSFGAIVSLSNSSHGLVHISHISSEFVQNINDYLALGDIIKCKVISVDNEKRKISLSIKELEENNKEKENTNTNIIKKEKEKEKVKEFIPRDTGFNRMKSNINTAVNFEDRIKDFLKSSNDRLSVINKRNKKK